MNKVNPYEFLDGVLGVKIKYLISDRNKADESLCLITYRALKKRMDSKTSAEKQLRRGSLGVDALVEYNTLQVDWKEDLTKSFGKAPEVVKKSFFSQHYFFDQEAYDFYLAHEYGERNEKTLPIKLIDEYTYNASVLNVVLEIFSNRKGMKKALGSTTMDVWDSLNKDVNSFTEVEHTLPRSRDGLRRKATQYKKEGYTSLISGKLMNNNAKKVVEDEQKAMLDELIAKHNNLENTMITTIYNAVATQMNWKTITAGTVANRKEEIKLVAFAGRKGTKDLENKILMQNKRSKPSAPMLYWTLDGWDVELYYQKTTINSKGHNVTTYTNRLNAVIVLDPYNKYPIGYAIGTHETPDLIKQAIQNAYNHVNELFGGFYTPYQLQSDNYASKTLTPFYEKVCKVYTPAKVGNAKSKVIEPWFNSINKKYFKLFNNWSGHNVVSGSESQPNQEYLNKIKKNFPDEVGCIEQIAQVLETIRMDLRQEYVSNFEPSNFVTAMSTQYFLNVLGSETGYTNRLRPEGLLPKINGQQLCFDSFDINFRMAAHVDWTVKYNPADLTQVLAVNEEQGYSFMLEEKYIQPMALADQVQQDAKERQRIKDFNNRTINYIKEERGRNGEVLEDFFFNNPQLQSTMAKSLLTDSLGQHKDYKSEERMQIETSARKLQEKVVRKEVKQEANDWVKQQEAYLKEKTNLDKYL